MDFKRLHRTAPLLSRYCIIVRNNYSKCKYSDVTFDTIVGIRVSQITPTPTLLNHDETALINRLD